MRLQPVVAVLFVLFSFVVSASPTPQWPISFSSTLDIFRRAERRYFVARWFRDEKTQMERFDTSGEQGWDYDIRRYDIGRRYTIFNDIDGLSCVISNLTNQMPAMDFSNYIYKGPAEIMRFSTYHFDAPSPSSLWTTYYQNQSNNNPLRLVSSNPSGEELTFFVFAAGPQNSSVFNTSVIAPKVECKWESDGRLGFVRIAALDAKAGEDVTYYSPPFLNQPGNMSSVLDCESGDASWYSCSGSGACASCTPSDYYAAHKTLPCGTSTTVTDTNNGKSVKVKIEDRGPFVTGRILDMNEAPAKALDMISAGVVPVRACW